MYTPGKDDWTEYKAKESKDVWMFKPYNYPLDFSHARYPGLMIKLSEYDASYDYPFIVTVQYDGKTVLQEFKLEVPIEFPCPNSPSRNVTIIYRPRKYIPPIGTWYSDLALAVKRDEDLILVSSDGVEFNINKFLFTARSEAFKKMLKSPTKEGEKKIVRFKNIPSDLLKSLVHYLKNDSLDETPEGSKEQLVHLAKLYHLPGLFKLCEDCLLEKMKGEPDSDIAHLAVKFGSYRLVRAYSMLLE